MAKYYLQPYQILPSKVIRQRHGLEGLQLILCIALPKLPFSRPQPENSRPNCGLCLLFPNGVESMASEYSLPVVLEKIYENQLALEAAIMELTLLAEQQGFADIGDNARAALDRIGENAGFVKQGLARLRAMEEE